MVVSKDLNAPVSTRTRSQYDLQLERLYAQLKVIDPFDPSPVLVPIPVPPKESAENTSTDSEDDDFDFSSEESKETESGYIGLKQVHKKGKRRVREDDSLEVIILDDSDDGEEEISFSSVNFGSTNRTNRFVIDLDEDNNGSRTTKGEGRAAVSKNLDSIYKLLANSIWRKTNPNQNPWRVMKVVRLQ